MQHPGRAMRTQRGLESMLLVLVAGGACVGRHSEQDALGVAEFKQIVAHQVADERVRYMVQDNDIVLERLVPPFNASRYSFWRCFYVSLPPVAFDTFAIPTEPGVQAYVITHRTQNLSRALSQEGMHVSSPGEAKSLALFAVRATAPDKVKCLILRRFADIPYRPEDTQTMNTQRTLLSSVIRPPDVQPGDNDSHAVTVYVLVGRDLRRKRLLVHPTGKVSEESTTIREQVGSLTDIHEW